MATLLTESGSDDRGRRLGRWWRRDLEDNGEVSGRLIGAPAALMDLQLRRRHWSFGDDGEGAH